MSPERTNRRAAKALVPFTAALTMAFALLPTAVSAQSNDAANQEGNDNHISVGAGVLFLESPFKGENTLTYPLPLVSIKQGPLYFEALEAGATFDRQTGPVTPSVSAFVAGRTTAARDRQTFTVDAGVRVGLSGDFGELSGEYRRDITGKFNGGEFAVRYAYPINAGKLTLIPSAQINWLDRKTANHMYGVTAGQRAKAIAKNRSVILPVAPITEKAMNLGGSLTGVFAVNDRISLIAVMSGTYLDKSIYKSPAIDQKWESSAIVAVAYRF